DMPSFSYTYYSHWTVDDWKRVTWSDEFSFGVSDGCVARGNMETTSLSRDPVCQQGLFNLVEPL
ncbi:hypothetical protein AVEN_182895-1, partial [Araneus ventricosus]